MNFYLGQKDNAHKVNVEVAPKYTETLDKTFDTATVVLEANTIQNPIAPMTAFYFEFSETETIKMYVQSDMVEVFSNSPLRYKHTLQLVQNIQELNKHLVRNSVFTQPAQKQKKSWWSGTEVLSEPYYSGDTTYALLKPLYEGSKRGECEIGISLESREKVKGTPYILVTYQCGTRITDQDNECYDYYENDQNINYGAEGVLFPLCLGKYNSNPEYYIVAYIYYDGGYELLRLNDIEGGQIVFNKPMYVPKLKSILENHTNVFIAPATEHHTISNVGEWDGYENAIQMRNVVGQVDAKYPYCKTEDDLETPAFIMTQMQIVCETYYYTCYDILDLLIKRQRQISGIGSKTPLFNLDPNSETGQLLKKTIAPNFTFTQCTMYECVAEVFRLFDAIFTLDENNYLVIDYLNNVQEDTPSVNETDFSGETRSVTDERYNGGLISYYQDARTKEVFPGKNNFVKATSKELTVPQQQDHVIITPHTIDNITKVFVRCSEIKVPIYYPNTHEIKCDFPVSLDVSSYVIEESIWTTLSNSQNVPVSNNDYKVVGQVNSVYYQKGGNTIELGFSYKTWIGASKFAFTNMLTSALHKISGLGTRWGGGNPNIIDVSVPGSQDWTNTFLQVEYETKVDGRVKNESITNKYDGEILIDQYNGSVDLQKMGLNMLGVSLQLGEPTLTATHKITSWNDRLRKGSVYIDTDGKKWVANVCSYTILNDGKIQGNITFTCNYNALAMRTKLSRERRMTNISPELTQKSEDNYVDFIYYATSSELGDYTGENTWFGSYFDTIIRNLFPCDLSNGLTIDTAAVLTSAVPNAVLYLPMIKYQSGNSLCFELSFDETMSAGKITNFGSTSFGVNGYFTSVVKYTDDYGFADTFNIALGNSSKMKTDSYPYVDLQESKMGISNLQVFKQPNEIFALNLQMCFLPLESRKDIDFMGRGFFDFNFLTNDNFSAKKLYIRYGKGTYNILDTEPIGSDSDVHELARINTFVTYRDAIGINLMNSDNYLPSSVFTCWDIEDSDGNIYFMSNKLNLSNSQTIYFLKRHTRIKE